jgi:ADP-ribose pyrophosphatase
MRVREDEISRDGTPGVYGVVEKKDSVVIAAIEDGQIHLVEQYRYPVGARYWELPQGIHHSNNGDALDDARAELLEETGLIAGRISEIGQAFQAYGYSDQKVILYHGSDLSRGRQQLEPEESDLITRPFPVAEFRRMIMAGEIKDSMTIACLALLDAHGLI